MSKEQDIIEAAKEWVRAEYQFRFGKNCYRNETTGWIVRAERRLRRALTGKGNLKEAYKALKERNTE